MSGDAGYADHPQRVGFFTDTSVCIGCKACAVACKERNALPEPNGGASDARRNPGRYVTDTIT